MTTFVATLIMTFLSVLCFGIDGHVALYNGGFLLDSSRDMEGLDPLSY